MGFQETKDFLATCDGCGMRILYTTYEFRTHLDNDRKPWYEPLGTPDDWTTEQRLFGFRAQEMLYCPNCCKRETT